MQLLGRILEILNTKMEIPQMYGWFHLLFMLLMIVSCVLLCRLKKHGDERFVRRLLLVSSLVIIALEIYKQINFNFSYDGSTINFDYQWYIFPFQFCSTPMYVGLVAAIVPRGRVHDALCAFLATFAIFAGSAVMLYPPQVFIDTIGINVQSMIWHSSMIVIGVYLLASGYVRAEHKTMLKAIPVFAACVVLAALMNEIAYISGILETETFNMFYISPHCAPSLPVYSAVQAVVPYPWCLFIYVFFFSLAAYLILLFAILAKHISAKCRRKAVCSAPAFADTGESTSENNKTVTDTAAVGSVDSNGR